jgi:hypothetical protein
MISLSTKLLTVLRNISCSSVNEKFIVLSPLYYQKLFGP